MFLCEDLTVNQSSKLVEKSKRGNLVSLSQCIFSDHLTPTLAYRCLVKENDHEAPSFLIESVEPGLQAGTVVSNKHDLYIVVVEFRTITLCTRAHILHQIKFREGTVLLGLIQQWKS